MEKTSQKTEDAVEAVDDGDDDEPSPSSTSKEGTETKPNVSNTVDGEKRKFRTLTFCRRYKSKGKETSKKRKAGPWSFKLSCCRIRKNLDAAEIPEPTAACSTCVCTGYRRTEEHHLGAGVVFETTPPSARRSLTGRFGHDYSRFSRQFPNDRKSFLPAIDLNRFNPKDYPTEDCDERARLERAREIEEGIDPPPSYQPMVASTSTQSLYRTSNAQLAQLVSIFHSRFSLNLLHRPSLTPYSAEVGYAEADPQSRLPLFEEPYLQRMVHTQVDYIHCLVPDLLAIANCQFYWGKMDRYEAEKLLENRPEGAFLLRDSAQEEYLFSVSFRRYGRLMHARIEQWNHRFSFDSHDPAVYSSETVCGLIEHYKDPNSCTSFEPMLTIPLHRTSTFSLQHLCRAVICNNTTYDSISRLHLPKPLKTYLKEYHYKQRVRIRRFDVEQ